MNPVVVVHFLAALVTIVAAVPLIRRRVKMNHWYGVRIPAAFASEEAWYDINHHGGRLLLYWGISIAATALIGAFVGRPYWVAYNWIALGVILVGLVGVLVQVGRYARKR